jgi:hypothetical protein
MSTKNVIDIPAGNMNIRRVTWSALANGEAGDMVGPDTATWSDRSVQVAGTLGAAGTVVWEGSNDGTNWATLNTPAGTPLSFGTAGLKQVLEGALYMRPRVTAGDATTALMVTLLLRMPTYRAG